jgi:uncharacterized SAM-binding protein YcdF (DUF218 family)
MELSFLKPLLTALVLPPAGPIALAFLGLLLAPRWRSGRVIGVLALASLWLLSCHAVAVSLERHLLAPPRPVQAADLKQAKVQAVVVLGGGVLPDAPEYGEPQPSEATAARLRYGVRLARTSNLPLAFAGGAGWSGNGKATEAEAVRAAAQRDFGHSLRWVDDQSRDTNENAVRMAVLLQREGVRRVALVSDGWHLPRATRAFERAGFEVLPAPTRLPFGTEHPVIEWLPSARGLTDSRHVLREWLGIQVARLTGG